LHIKDWKRDKKMKGKRGKKVLRLIFASSGSGDHAGRSASQDTYQDSMIPVEDRVCAEPEEGGTSQTEKADPQGRA
jgi:hypothetical protein